VLFWSSVRCAFMVCINTFMLLSDFSTLNTEYINEQWNVKQIIASALLGVTFIGQGYESTARAHTTSGMNVKLTRLGRDIIRQLPLNVQKLVGNPNEVIFVTGIPVGGDPDAICQVEKGKKIIFVNPKWANKLSGDMANQVVSHEALHIAQDHLPPDEAPNEHPSNPHKYEDLEGWDAYDKLKVMRAHGDTMKNHSREAQGIIMQHYIGMRDKLRELKQSGASRSEIKQYQDRFDLFSQYIAELVH